MHDDSDVKIKRRWETDPLRRNSPVIDPERECDNFCRAFCEDFCREFCGEFFEEILRDDRAERGGDMTGGAGDSHGHGNESGAGNTEQADDGINVVDYNNDRLEACREKCRKICFKVCRKVYWEHIHNGPMA